MGQIDRPHHCAIDHVRYVGYEDGKECSLRDGLGRIVQVSGHIGPGCDACNGGKEDREHGPECLILVIWSKVLREGIITPTSESFCLLLNAPG